VFVGDPTVVARAVTLTVTVCPGAIVPRSHVISAGERLQVPCEALTVRYVMPAGAGSASWTFVAVSGPLFVTVSE
jgi:hypothetical protein